MTKTRIHVAAAVAGATMLLGAARATAATLYGVGGGGTFLVRLESASPQVITDAAAVTGLQAGERLGGIDFRPRTGQLYGIGIVTGATDTVRVYVIDPTTGVATTIAGSTPFTVTTGAAYGIAFNPTVDRIRVVNSGDENFRVNPNNGARADTPTNDTDINPAANSIAAVAYDRSFDTGLAVANRTTLFAISIAGNNLVTLGGINQSPSPNGGAVMNAHALGLDPTGDAGFDIDVGGTAFAALTVAGLSRLYTVDLTTGAATVVGSIGDGNFGISGLAAAPPTVLAVGADAGTAPVVRVLDGSSGSELFNLAPYDPKLKKGVRVALGDVNLDSVPEVITAPGKGGPPEVRVFDGVTGLPLAPPLGSFLAFDADFKGGVFVAAGDINGDGSKDIITGAGPGGGPHVRVFSGANGSQLLDLAAYDETFKGGVEVACADFDLDGDCEIVTGAGKGGASRLRVFDAAGNPFTSASLPAFVNDFTAYPSTFKGGVFVAAGDVNGDGRPDIITGPDKGTSEVAVFSGVDGSELARFLPFGPKAKGGVRVAAGDVDGDGRAEILAAPSKGKGTEIHAFDGVTLEEKTHFLAFDAEFKKGVFVAGVRR